MRYIPVHRVVFDHGRRGRFVSGCWVYLERFLGFPCYSSTYHHSDRDGSVIE